jgi:hypothetical protein
MEVGVVRKENGPKTKSNVKQPTKKIRFNCGTTLVNAG